MKKIGLVPKLLMGIVGGIIIGLYFPEWFARLVYTFTSIFGQFLNYVVPLIILAFIIPGIAEVGGKAGKLLGTTAGIAYLSTLIAGTLVFFIAATIVPGIIESGTAGNPEEGGLVPYLTMEIPPIMGVMTALVTSFIFGLGINFLKNEKSQKTLFDVMNEFREITVLVIQKVIIPLLPIHIAGVFTNMAATGTAFKTLSVFGKVFALVIAMHLGYLIMLYLFAGTVSRKNPFKSLRNMVPAYTTAIGTMSSAATIPVTLRSAKSNNVSEKVADFVIPLCATIHLAGSTITLTTCSVAVVILNGGTPIFADFFPFIVMLGLTMIAAPGVPGGAVMAALGLLSSILGFGEPQLALMIGLYLAQDSFGTACNVTGDGAIAILVDTISKKFSKGEISTAA